MANTNNRAKKSYGSGDKIANAVATATPATEPQFFPLIFHRFFH